MLEERRDRAEGQRKRIEDDLRSDRAAHEALIAARDVDLTPAAIRDARSRESPDREGIPQDLVPPPSRPGAPRLMFDLQEAQRQYPEEFAPDGGEEGGSDPVDADALDAAWERENEPEEPENRAVWEGDAREKGSK